MAGRWAARWVASSWDCSTPCEASEGSEGMPVGVGKLCVYSPVSWMTTQLERNWCCQ